MYILVDFLRMIILFTTDGANNRCLEVSKLIHIVGEIAMYKTQDKFCTPNINTSFGSHEHSSLQQLASESQINLKSTGERVPVIADLAHVHLALATKCAN
jgi:hypothetical protein